MNTEERVLPHDLPAEKAVLGAVLIDNARLVDACAIVAAGDFFRDAHRRLFKAMVAVADRREAVDMVSLRDQLNRTSDLNDVGGPSYIAELMDGVPRSTNVDTYARIVKEKARLRELVHSGKKLVASAYAADRDASEILEAAEQAILGLAGGSTPAGFESMAAIAPRVFDALERAHNTRGGINGVATGFTDLDNLTRGLQSGTLVVLGARPGMGKTSLAINIAQHCAFNGLTAGVYSLEMPSEELFIRQIAARARLDSHSLQGGFISTQGWAQVAEAINAIADTPMHVDQTPGITAFEVRSRARRLKAEHGLDLLVIDYLQLMGTSHNRNSNRAQELGEITSSLKGLAKELKIPILLLSQLSREPEKRGTKPRLSDLRESGSIEQDADIVMFLHRAEDGVDTVTDLSIAKHRNGPIGSIKLAWHERQTRFADYSDFPEPEDQRLPMGDR